MELLDAPLLESLTLAITDIPDTTSLPSIFSEAPLLSTIKFLGCSNNNILFWTRTQLPWGQLRRVQIDQANVANLRFLSNDYQQANGENRTLVLSGPFDSSRTYCHFHPEMPFALHVTTLVLDSLLWTNNLCKFFRNVTIPTLEDLTIIPPDPISFRQHLEFVGFWSNPLDALEEFLQSSQCKLRTFSLVMRRTVQPTLADSLVDTLISMSSLTRLQIIEAESGPSLFNEGLCEQLSRNGFLPELTSLELVWAENRQPNRELLSALSARADGRLSSVVLGIRKGGDIGPEVLKCRQDLRRKDVRATCW